MMDAPTRIDAPIRINLPIMMDAPIRINTSKRIKVQIRIDMPIRMGVKIQKIQDHYLLYTKYDIETLEYNIDKLSLKNLLLCQILTAAFCKKYLLNPDKYDMSNEHNYISKEDILYHQPHIKKEELN
tara:strand:+ start:225 stop:605 length:381 start_codon:yes stop_codon:yes gene_type:complete